MQMDEMIETTAEDIKREPLAWSEGILPGLAGGFVMTLVLVILAEAVNAHPFAPFVLIATTLLGKSSYPGIAALLFGVGVHFLVSAIFGSLFATVVGRIRMRSTLGLGLLFGVLIWAGVQFVFLPLVNPGMATQLGVVWPFFLGHAAYGLMLAACLPVFDDIDAPRLIAVARIPPQVALRALGQTTDAMKGAVSTVVGQKAIPVRRSI